MKLQFSHLLFCLVATSVCFVHASHAQDAAQPIPAAVQREVSFENDVHAILAERCFDCHSEEKRRGGLWMSGRDALIEGGESGPSVVVGNSAESYLIQLISGQIEDQPMPPKGDRVPENQIAILRAWIDQGLEWDFDEVKRDAWVAPMAPRDPDVPRGRGIHRSKHPIDRFVARYLKENDIRVPELVDDRTFARRVSLDVLGLLPNEAQLDAFLADKTKSKRANFVAAALQSDRDYAEHWMTFWNDSLRNDFQGTGYIDGGRKQITAWLYDALYENMPYDEFVASLIDPAEANEGFINGIVWRGVTVAAQQPPLQAARSVSQVFLGVNLKCTSCHDSFIDDWKLTDAYGMAACFSEEPLDLVRCGKPTGRTAEAKFLWPELGEIDGSVPRQERMARVSDLVTQEENGRFARTIVNRIWAAMMGRGLVEPLENLDKKPWSPDLLDWLAYDFAQNGYDVRALIETIATSKTYQLASVSSPPDSDEPWVFRGPEARRLSAEQLLDAISRVSGVWQSDSKFAIPDGQEAAPGVGIRAWRIPADPLTRALGRPNREQVTLRRLPEFTTLQAVEMTNGETLSNALQVGAKQLVEELGGTSPDNVVETLYVRGLQRPPNDAEMEAANALLGESVSQEGMADLLWAMAMLPEFQLVY